MAKVDYKTVDRKKMDRYLRPELEEASLSDVITPIATMLMFFTKPGQALMGGAMKGLFKGAVGAGKGLRGIGKFAGSRAVKAGLSVGDRLVGGVPTGGLKVAQSLADRGAGAITSAAERGARYGARYASNLGKKAVKAAVGAGRFVQRHPGLTGTAIVGAGLFGGVRAGLDKKPLLLKMDVGRGNPSLGRMYKQPGKGLSPGHLGATGDLTLNMNRGR